jgi:L-amino acid N-acyltransferase YncA
MIEVFQASEQDAAELSGLMNAIIVRGGTTAYEDQFSPQQFAEHFISGDHCVSCLKAVDAEGSMLGFQVLARQEFLPDGWVDIGTFTRVGLIRKGVGQALFKPSLEVAQLGGFHSINATIRADNASGLAYYAKIGFTDYNILMAVPLKDGTPVDRICKRYEFRF